MDKLRIRTVLVLAVALLMPAVAAASDYPLLEMLIENHKKQSDRLRDRTLERGLLVTAALLEKDASGDYTEVAEKLAKKGGDIVSYLAFGVEMAKALADVADLADLEIKAVDRSLEVGSSHPYILLKAAAVEYQVGEILKEVTRYTYYVATSSIGVTLATQEQRMMFVSNIKDALWKAKYKLNSLIWDCDQAAFRHINTTGQIEDLFKAARNFQESSASSIINEINAFAGRQGKQ